MDYDSVLLMAFGGPENREDVRPFLANVFRGSRVPDEQIEEVVERYKAIGGASPLNKITFQQSYDLSSLLKYKKKPLKVYVGMLNWSPNILSAMEAMKNDGRKTACGIILAPHKCEIISEWYRFSVLEAQQALKFKAPKVVFSGHWHTHPLFIDAICDCVCGAIGLSSPPSAGEKCKEVDEYEHWVFTAPNIPAEMDADVDYSGQVFATARLVAQRFGKHNSHVAYQFRYGQVSDNWLEPDINEKIRELAAQGAGSVLVIPVSFAADCAEVLYDLDIRAAEGAGREGIKFARAATVGTGPKFIEMLSELVTAL